MRLSGARAVSSLLGLVAGIWLYSPSKRYRIRRSPTSIPYTGPKRWHVIFGLIFGTFACTWVFSGFLSMSPFDWLANGHYKNIEDALRGRLDVAMFAGKDPPQAIAEGGSGTAGYGVGTQLIRRRCLVFRRGGSAAFTYCPDAWQCAGSNRHRAHRGRSEAGCCTGDCSGDTARYQLRALLCGPISQEQPLPVLYLRLNDAGRSTYYIDPRNGRIVQSYSTTSRWNAAGSITGCTLWISLGFMPGRPAWDILVIVLLLGELLLPARLCTWLGRLFGEQSLHAGNEGRPLADARGSEWAL